MGSPPKTHKCITLAVVYGGYLTKHVILRSTGTIKGQSGCQTYTSRVTQGLPYHLSTARGSPQRCRHDSTKVCACHKPYRHEEQKIELSAPHYIRPDEPAAPTTPPAATARRATTKSVFSVNVSTDAKVKGATPVGTTALRWLLPLALPPKGGLDERLRTSNGFVG